MRISDWSSDVCSSDLVIFAHAPDLESGQAYYADVKARATGFGRDPGQLFVMPGIAPTAGDTDEDAEARSPELAAPEPIATGRGLLSRTLKDHDLPQYEPEHPFPDAPNTAINRPHSYRNRVIPGNNGEISAE